MNRQVLEDMDSSNTGDSYELQTGHAYSAMTKLAILWRNKAIGFATKIKPYGLSILFYGCESWRWIWNLVNSSLWKQELQEDAWCIILRTQDKWIHMATDECPCQTTGVLIIKHQMLQVIAVRPCLLTWRVAEQRVGQSLQSCGRHASGWPWVKTPLAE